MKTGKRITLDAETYDTMHLMALAMGGIGHDRYSSSVYADDGNGDYLFDAPVCAIGFGNYADEQLDWPEASFASRLRLAGIDETFNDNLVTKLLKRGIGNQMTKRVTWAQYTKFGNIVRGPDEVITA